MRSFCVAVLVCLLGSPATSHAGYFYSGNELANLMAEYQKAIRKDKDVDYSDAWKFRAYVIGVHDTADEGLFCTPENARELQVAAITAKFIENNPKHWNKSGSELVIMALSQAWPCPKKS